jgi:hypothetical protein
MALETTGGPEIAREYPICSGFLARGLPIAGYLRLVNLTCDPCCGLHERPFFPLHGGIIVFAHAAFFDAASAQSKKIEFTEGLEAALR